MRGAWLRGDWEGAEKIAVAEAAAADENDRLVWELDAATLLRANGRDADARAALDKAAETVGEWDEKAETLLSKEASATLYNLTALPYRGRGSDRIMLHTYRALNFLETGRNDDARVALNAAYRAQTEAVEANAEAIEAARENAAKNEVDLEKLSKEPDVASKLRAAENSLPEVAVYADYVNPFTTWLHGIYFLYAGTDVADRERARKSLSRVESMEPGNSFVAEDAARAEDAADPAEPPRTYVIFEYGTAPTLVEERADLLLPFPTGHGFTIAPVGIALPKLAGTQSPATPALTADGVPAQRVCDMKRVVKTDFENAYPGVLARTLTTAFVKTAASVAANFAASEYARRDGSAGSALIALGTMVGTSVATIASAEADLRLWQTLPDSFYVASFPTPASRCAEIFVGSRRIELALAPGRVNVVCVRTVGTEAAPRVSQFVLRK